mmetsp:Transcript_21706/g.53833  ORF Transcript_21706/g.53833 Transcript_21706/m.53833 type:complete len:202 (+) Transcript_21706:929-1534(+)
MLSSQCLQGSDRLVQGEQNPSGQRRNLRRKCVSARHGRLFVCSETGIQSIARGTRAGTRALRPFCVCPFQGFRSIRIEGGCHVLGEPRNQASPPKAQRSVLHIVSHAVPGRRYDDRAFPALLGVLGPGLFGGEPAPNPRAKGCLAILLGRAWHSAPRCDRRSLLLDGFFRVFAFRRDTFRAGAGSVPRASTRTRPPVYPRR